MCIRDSVQGIQPLNGGCRLLKAVELLLVLLQITLILPPLHHERVQQQQEGGGKEDGYILEYRPLAALPLSLGHGFVPTFGGRGGEIL